MIMPRLQLLTLYRCWNLATTSATTALTAASFSWHCPFLFSPFLTSKVLLGFSQGASSIALFLSRLQVREPDLLEGLQCAVLIGGFLPQNPLWANEIACGPGPPPIRSLHIYGAADERVTPARGKALAAAFKVVASKAGLKTEEHEHPGAHMVSGYTKN